VTRTTRLLLSTVTLLLAGTPIFAQKNTLRPESRNYYFGSVGIDFRVAHDFRLINTGSEPVRIDTVDPHCDCTAVRFQDSVVAPNDTARIRIIFNTADFYGPVSKSVRVSSDNFEPREMKLWYHATIGQWQYSVEPDPVSLFFLPVHKKHTLKILNHALDFIAVDHIEILDDIIQVETVRDEASKGGQMEFTVTPQSGLESGEHLTNFTIQFKVPEGLEPLRITIPVKIVRY
jgi:hypothetical protein